MSMSTTPPGSQVYWDALLLGRPGGGYRTHFVNTFGEPQPPVSKAWWCRRISAAGKTGNQMMQDLVANLGPPSQFGVENGYPAMVMFDEMHSQNGTEIGWLCHDLYYSYGHLYNYRWGVYLVNGPLVNYSAFPLNTLDWLFFMNARIGVELYPIYKTPVPHDPPFDRYNYWSGGSSTSIRDEWLRQFMVGGSNYSGNPVPTDRRPANERLDWLMGWKTRWPSSLSLMHPIFGVTSRFINGSQQERFMDRLFYVFQRSSQGHLMGSGNDLGVGSWKWDGSQSLDYWDSWFVAMWDYYCENFSPGKAARRPAPTAP